MSSYTTLGSCIWEWEPFTTLDPVARILWLALYTTAEAKRIVPGLWHGSITAMAEAAKLPVDDTMKALDRLLERNMAEFDQKHRVLRLTQLPDGRESPPNGNVIRGWFKRFKTVPACQVRDAHVTTLAWIMNEWSRDAGKPISDGHQQAWAETFAHVTIPPPRRRGVRSLVDNNTGTDVQPGLFDAQAAAPSSSSVPGSDSGSDAADENAHVGFVTVSRTVPRDPDARSVDNSVRSPDLNQINNSGTTVKPFRNGSDQDQDPDPDLDLLFGRSGTAAGEIANPPPTVARTSTGRLLSLVPLPPTPAYTPEELLQRLSEGGAYRPAIVREASQAALCATIATLVARGIGPPELARIAQHIARHGLPPSNAERWYQLSDWASDPERILRAYEAIGTHERKAEAESAALAEIKRQLGYT